MGRRLVSDLHKVRLLYFLQCASGCCISNFLVVFLRDKNLTLPQIGFMCGAIWPFASMLAQPLWAYLADRTRQPKRVMMVSLLLGAGATFCLQYFSGFRDLALVYGASALLVAAVNPLLDSTTMTTLLENGVPISGYGRFRVFGAIGWGAAAPVIGVMIDHFGYRTMFYDYAVIGFFYILTMASFPVRTDASEESSAIVNHKNSEEGEIAGEEQGSGPLSRERLSFFGFLARLMSIQDVPIFCVLVYAMGVCKGVIDVFLFLHLQDLGASGILLGTTLAVTTVSEIPFFFYSGPLIKKFGAMWVVLFAMFVFGARLCYYWLLKEPWWVMPAELLHGITFSLSWSTVASHATVISPKGYSSTTQAFLSALFWGFGFGSGAMTGGYINHHYGAALLFLYSAYFCAGVLVLVGIPYTCVVLCRRSKSSCDVSDTGQPPVNS